jgi:hypothetical protein
MGGLTKMKRINKSSLIIILLLFLFGVAIKCKREKAQPNTKHIKKENVISDKSLSDPEVRYCNDMKEFHGVWIGKVVNHLNTLCICVEGFSEILESCGSDFSFPIKIMSIEKKKSGIYKMQYHTWTDGGDGTKPTYLNLKLHKQKLYYQSIEYKFYDEKKIPKWDAAKSEFILTK